MAVREVIPAPTADDCSLLFPHASVTQEGRVADETLAVVESLAGQSLIDASPEDAAAYLTAVVAIRTEVHPLHMLSRPQLCSDKATYLLSVTLRLVL